MAKYTYKFVVKKDDKKVLEVEIDQRCICINENKITGEALNELRHIADEKSCEPNQYAGLRKHFSNIVRMFTDYSGKIGENTKRMFDNILN